jgi:DNA repair protein RecN (Recombination protein N)
LEAGREDDLKAERERLRHLSELVEAASGAVAALAPEEGDGATDLVAMAERAMAPVEALAPELTAAGDTLRQAELQLREVASDLKAFLLSLEAEPGRLEELEAELERYADLRRRFQVQTYAELLEAGNAARAELSELGDGGDPAEAAKKTLEKAQAEVDRIHNGLRAARTKAAKPFADAVAAELKGIGLGDGEFRAELKAREPGPAGADEVAFLIKPNAGLPFGPAAEQASGGELSRIALAIAAVGGGETMVFDEIDAGIGGTTAHAVAETLQRLAGRAQVITITHLPQIATVAERHFSVEKVPGDPTHTRIEPLDDAQRRDELERMLGGAEFLATFRQ